MGWGSQRPKQCVYVLRGTLATGLRRFLFSSNTSLLSQPLLRLFITVTVTLNDSNRLKLPELCGLQETSHLPLRLEAHAEPEQWMCMW